MLNPNVLRWGLVLSLVACAHTPNPPVAEPTPAPKVVATPVAPLVNPGPTRTDSQTMFVDRTREVGLDGVHGVRFNAVDMNGDGATDLVVLPDDMAHPLFFLWNLREKRFSPLGYNPFDQTLRVSFLLFADLNKDGVIDVITSTFNRKSELSPVGIGVYRGEWANGRLHFVEIGNAIPIPPGPVASLSLIDINLDGKFDLFVGNWFKTTPRGAIPVPDHLLVADDFFHFKDASVLLTGEQSRDRDYKVYYNARPTFGSSTCDLDQNGLPDILTAMSSGFPNRLWMNTVDDDGRAQRFRDYGMESNFAMDFVGRGSPTGGGDSTFSICADYNDDGIMDAFIGTIVHAYDGETRDKSSILTGYSQVFPPKFFRSEYINDESPTAQWAQGDRRGIWIDLDLDGHLDLLIENAGFPPSTRLTYLHQTEDHAFNDDKNKDAGIDILNPAGVIVADWNRDGRPDVLVGQSSERSDRVGTRIYYFENRTPFQKGQRSLRTHLVGGRANAMGIGAMVILETSKGKRRQWVEYAQGGFPSQNEEGLFWGLRPGEVVKSITVRWPFLDEKGEKAFSSTRYQYSLQSLAKNKTSSLTVTLCDSGRWAEGNASCR